MPRGTLAAVVFVVLAGCSGPASGPSAPSVPDEGAGPGSPPALACVGACDVQVPMGPGKAFEPDVAVDPLDALHAVIVQTPIRGDPAGASSRSLELHGTRDGGASWSTRFASEEAAIDPASPFVGCTLVGDAVAAFLPDGRLLVGAMVGRHVGALSMLVMTSSDGGATFGDHAWLEAAHPGIGCGATPVPSPGAYTAGVDKPEIATAPDGSAVVVWHSNGVRSDGRTPLLAAFSSDGRTWDPAIDIEALAGSLGVYVQMDSRLDVGMASFGPGGLVRFALTEDGGATWRTSEVGPTSNNYPGYARVHTANGTVHLVAFNQPDGGGVRPALATSADGTNWTVHPLAPTGPQSAMVAMAAANGTAYISFWTDGPEEGITRQVRAWRDGSLGPPIGVDGPVRPQAHDMTPVGYGHYQGLAAYDGGAYLAWGAGVPAQASLHAGRVTLQ